MPRGTYRRVFHVGRYALKVPRLRHFLRGLRCNRWEREEWRIWRPLFHWQTLCPVLSADPLGLFVVMPWAPGPVTIEQLEQAIDAESDNTVFTSAELKVENFGLLCGLPVAVDYGLPTKSDVEERRTDYKKWSRIFSQ